MFDTAMILIVIGLILVAVALLSLFARRNQDASSSTVNSVTAGINFGGIRQKNRVLRTDAAAETKAHSRLLEIAVAIIGVLVAGYGVYLDHFHR